MHRIFTLLFLCMMSSSSYTAGMVDDPLLTMVRIDQLEITDIGDENDLAWDAQAWLGKDLNKIWFKTEGEQIDNDFEEVEIQLLYSRAIASYWDAQIGWRHDIKPKPTRDWLAVGVQGLAPYFFETDIALFVGESGSIGLRTKLEYEFLFTQKLVLTPKFEANLFSKNDKHVETGSGLSDINLGLRLRYEIKRKFAPYIGIEWDKRYGNTADFARDEGEDVSETRWVAGIRLWF